MGRLHLYRGEAALERAIEARLLGSGPRSAIEVGRELTSIPRLLDEAARGIAPGIGPLGERLLLRAVCQGPLVGARPAPPPSAVPRLGAIVAALRRAGISAAALRLTAPRLLGRPSEDASWIAALLERYEQLLGGRLDDAGRIHEALRRLASAPVPSLREIGEVELHDAAPFDPPVRAVIDALAARGLVVRVHVAEPPPRLTHAAGSRYEEALAAALAKHLEALEAITAAQVERVVPSMTSGPTPEVVRAATPLHEARLIAMLVRDRILAGAAPDDIAIVADDADVRAQLAIELASYGMPVAPASSGSLLDAGTARLVPAIYRLLADGLPRDGLIDLITSPHVHVAGSIGAARIGAVLRTAVPVTAEAGGLGNVLSRYVGSCRGDDRVEAEAIVEHVTRVVGLLRSLPARATLEKHASALARVLAGLGVLAPSPRPSAPPEPGARAGRGLSRETAARRGVQELLAALPGAAQRSGVAPRSYERHEVAQLFVAELASTMLPGASAHGAAVHLCELGRLPDSAWALLVLAGLEEGSQPARAEEDPLLSDETRHVLNRAFDRPVLPLSTQAELRARVQLANARSSAAALVLYSARADEAGRPRLAGELVEHARALGAVEAQPHWEMLAPLHARLSLDERAAAERRARLGALSAIEEARAAFFAGERNAGRHDGRLLDASLLAALAAGGLPGTKRQPLSASTITRYVECPQRFFLESVLRVRADEPLEDEIDERATGALAHLALERLFRAWRDRGLFPLSGRPEEEAQLAPALDAAVAAFLTEQPRGNELAFQSRVRTLARTLEGVWRREIAEPIGEGLRPTHFELRFDGLALPGALAEEAPAYLRGAIDRVDVDLGGERAVVIDYKSGRLAPLKPELKPEAFCDTSWQLPIYAAVARAQLGVREVEMAYYSLKELDVAHEPAPATLAFSDASDAGLAAQLWSRVRAMRDGYFAVAPQAGACDRCRLQPACRIVERRDGDGDGA